MLELNKLYNMDCISQKERFLRYSATTLPASLILRRNA